jgi:uncharacterized protein (DUF849 family)
MLIEAAINGSRSKSEHPLIPLSSLELADAALGAAVAGATAVHFHARAENGQETLAAEHVGQNLKALRSKVKDVSVGVSTGAWIIADPAIRYATIYAWNTLPDFASVNFHEPGASQLAEMLSNRGVGIEAGISSSGAAREFVNSGLAGKCLRLLIEPQEQTLESALATVSEIETILTAGSIKLPLVLHGLNDTAWPLLDVAIRRGHSIRIGFEDTLKLRNGNIARDNAELIHDASARIGMMNFGKREDHVS